MIAREQFPDIEGFLRNMEKHVEGAEPGSFQADEEFRQIPQWSSMQSLIVLASFDWDYGIILEPVKMQEAKTFRDLYRALLFRFD